MQITQEEKGNNTAVLKVVVEPQDYQPKIDTTLKDYRKKAQLNGFRKGMVPLGVIKKMYGQQVLAEEMGKILQESINKYIDENKIAILGQPMPITDENLELDIYNSQEYTFNYDLGLAPEVEVKALDKNPKFTKNIVEIDDEIINEEVGQLQKRYGKAAEADKVEADDVLAVTFIELDDKGEVKEGGIMHETTISDVLFKTKKLKDELKGKKVKDELTIDLYKDIDREPALIEKHILGLKDGAPDGMSSTFKFRIDKITRVENAELNQEFFDSIYGPGTVKSEKELKERIKTELENHYSQGTDRQLNNEILKHLIENTECELPDEFLKKWIKFSNEKPITEEQVKKEYPDFAKSLKWNLISDRLANKYEVKVEAADVKSQMMDNLKKQFSFMEADEGSEKALQLEQYVEHLMKDQKQVKETYDFLFEKQLFDKLHAEVSISEKKIGWKEFNELVKK